MIAYIAYIALDVDERHTGLGNTCIDQVTQRLLFDDRIVVDDQLDVKRDALHPHVADSHVLRYGLPDRLHTGAPCWGSS